MLPVEQKPVSQQTHTTHRVVQEETVHAILIMCVCIYIYSVYIYQMGVHI